MAYPSQQSAPQHSGNATSGSSYKGDREPQPKIADPNIPPDDQVIPPRDGDGDGDEQ